MRGRGAVWVVLVLLAVLVVGCARFPDEGQQWRDRPDLNAERAPQPQLPRSGEPSQAPQGGASPARPGPCVDPDPQVVATCLAPVSTVVTLPGGAAALVAERTTGRILRVAPGQAPQVVATVPVDPAGDGGLTSLALSPSYDEDQLLYVYATTPTGNAVLRVAQNDAPKPVVGGIPRGQVRNAGAVGVEPDGTLLVATGDGGDARAATDPASLAGKLLRIDPFGRPVKGAPGLVVGSGLHAPGDICADPTAGLSWVTDRAGPRDVLVAVPPRQAPGAQAAAAPAWTWPERPNVAGCAAAPGMLVVGLEGARSAFVLRPTPGGAFVGTPQTTLAGTYGRLRAADLSSDGYLWLGTTNKDEPGAAGPTDDRVIRIKPPAGGAAGAE